MTWTIWDAPSDRDYYGQQANASFTCEDDDEDGDPNACRECGATPDEAHEEWCPYHRSAPEPAPIPEEQP